MVGPDEGNGASVSRRAHDLLTTRASLALAACVLLAHAGASEAFSSSRPPFRTAAAGPSVARPKSAVSPLLPRRRRYARDPAPPGRGDPLGRRRAASEASLSGVENSSDEIADSLTNSDVVADISKEDKGSPGSSEAESDEVGKKNAVPPMSSGDAADGSRNKEAPEVSSDELCDGEPAGPATSFFCALGDSEEERSLKRNEMKLKKSVKEVKETAKEVKESVTTLKDKLVDQAVDDKEVITAVANVTGTAGKLGGKIIDRGPSILGRVFLGLFSKEIREDFKRRRAVYLSDWTDAFGNKRQTVPAILFLYFACLAPAVSFGTIASQLTNGSIGVVEFLLSSGCSGMIYAALCGQPMAFIAPTGLTLAFISGLFRFCSLKGIPFFPVYTWVGLWTSFFMISLGMAGSSKLIRYCTRFTDEVFNALLSINFIYEAVSSLRRNFQNAPDPSNLTMPFVALSMALGTFYSTLKVTAFQTSKYFNKRIRTIIKDFGPVSILAGMSVLNLLPSVRRFDVPTLSVPHTFELAGGRDFLIPLASVSWGIRALCAFPAVLLTALFFMDQNISVRVVNNPDNKLKKGPAYNLDMVALGLITAGLSVFGLPWMCGATVQSLNHLRAMTTTHFNEDTQAVEIEHVTETRFTGFTIHALIFATIRALPLLSYLPIPVVSGVFLFLGKKLMVGNNFVERIGDGIAERKRLPKDHPVHLLGRKKMNVFTSLQVLCLAGLWAFKQNSATAIFFPSVIGMLMVIRSLLLPKFFSEEELVALGDPTPK